MPFVESEHVHIYEKKFDIKSEIDKLDLENLDEAVYLCDLSDIVNKFNIWMKYMPNVLPYYAVKCNDEINVLKTLADLGIGFDCASKAEIEKILKIGVSANRIVYSHPMKSKSFIKYAKSVNVTDSSVDNEYELYKLHKHYPESNIILRFRSDAKKVLSSLGNKYGCDAETDGPVLMLLAKSLNLNIIGVSFHVGSGCSDAPAYENAISTASSLFKFGKKIGHPMKILDIGGGFPGDDEAMFANIAKVVNYSVSEYFKDIDVKVIAEPGRFFVYTAYTLVSKVLSKRDIRSQNGEVEKMMYFLNDGLFGTFNFLMYEDIKIEVIHFKDKNCKKFNTLLWGPTCDGCDKICDNVFLPNLREGDILTFPNMGAYTIPLLSPFNGFDNPKTRFYLGSDYV